MKQKTNLFMWFLLLLFISVPKILAQHVQPLDTSLYAPISGIELNADGSEGEETYDLIKKAFGSSSLEVPDLYENNHPDFQHVQEGTDSDIGPYFIFYMHRDTDWDRDKYSDISDRQRNEIKLYDGSKEIGKGRENEVFRYTWKVFIGESMTISKNFCHFFQLKAVDGDDSHPILTLTGSVNSGIPEVELLHSPSSDDTQLISNNWEKATGQWMQAECIALYADDGFMKFSLKTLAGETILETEQSHIDMWREGSSYVRPKWGIYRSLKSKELILNETDTVKMANYSIEELQLKSEIPNSIFSRSYEKISFNINQDILSIRNIPSGDFNLKIYNVSGSILQENVGVSTAGEFVSVTINVESSNQILILKLKTKDTITNAKIIF